MIVKKLSRTCNLSFWWKSSGSRGSVSKRRNSSKSITNASTSLEPEVPPVIEPKLSATNINASWVIYSKEKSNKNVLLLWKIHTFSTPPLSQRENFHRDLFDNNTNDVSNKISNGGCFEGIRNFLTPRKRTHPSNIFRIIYMRIEIRPPRSY